MPSAACCGSGNTIHQPSGLTNHQQQPTHKEQP
jgi:hypothetical protein